MYELKINVTLIELSSNKCDSLCGLDPGPINVLGVVVELEACKPLLESIFEFEAVDGGRSEAGSAELSRGSACAGEISTSSDRFGSMLIFSRSLQSSSDVCRIDESHHGVIP